MRIVTTFHGTDGARHRVVSLRAKEGGMHLLVDLWEGHGPRLVAILDTRDGNVNAANRAAIREYRADAAISSKPLSRMIGRGEIAQTASSSA